MSKPNDKDLFPPTTLSPGEKVQLSDIDPRKVEGTVDKKSARAIIKSNALEMADLCRRMYAENKNSILLVLQGMDTAGKDGTIRAVMRGVNPRSCQVHSFKKPSEEELDHDFLWRVHKVAPRKGNIAIFNRSHYEDVLVVRVHELVPDEVWEERYEQINQFEKMLTQNGTTIVKCFLHISKDRQRERLQERIDVPEKNWKFNPGDIAERKLWSDYQLAYKDAISLCNTEHAPWHIIPSDRKWYRNLVVSQLLLNTLRKLDPQYPNSEGDYKGVVVD